MGAPDGFADVDEVNLTMLSLEGTRGCEGRSETKVEASQAHLKSLPPFLPLITTSSARHEAHNLPHSILLVIPVDLFPSETTHGSQIPSPLALLVFFVFFLLSFLVR